MSVIVSHLIKALAGEVKKEKILLIIINYGGVKVGDVFSYGRVGGFYAGTFVLKSEIYWDQAAPLNPMRAEDCLN